MKNKIDDKKKMPVIHSKASIGLTAYWLRRDDTHLFACPNFAFVYTCEGGRKTRCAARSFPPVLLYTVLLVLLSRAHATRRIDGSMVDKKTKMKHDHVSVVISGSPNRVTAVTKNQT